jgi:uncharacterized membrane protein YkvI
MSSLKIMFVIVGTLIGAGFASGQEIYVFFFSYGAKGIIGIILSSCIIGITIYKTLEIVRKKECKNYKELLEVIIKNEKIRDMANAIINVFILATFYIMIAGFGAYVEQEFNINSIICSSALAVLCYIVFRTNIKGFVNINQVLIPILILIIFFIGYLNFKNIDFKNINNYLIEINKNWIISAVLYASYNSILLIPVLISTKDFINKKQDIKYIAEIVTVIVALLSIVIYLFLINVDVDIRNLEMPAVYAINKISINMKFVYGLTIMVSIFTTAISMGISLLKNTSKSGKTYNIYAILICLSSVFFAKLGFSNLVNWFYPILGFFGLVQIAKILMYKINF